MLERLIGYMRSIGRMVSPRTALENVQYATLSALTGLAYIGY